MPGYIVHKTIKIQAEPMAVWKALTTPSITKKYFFNCEVFSGWKPGDAIIFKGKMFLFFNIELKGKILQAIPGRLLKYTLKNGKKEDTEAGESVVTDELKYENGQTVVTITDNVGTGEGAERRYKRSVKGWDKILTGLKKVVEAQS